MQLVDLEEKNKRILYLGVNKVGKYVYIEENLNEV
jgi:hypothetical protein